MAQRSLSITMAEMCRTYEGTFAELARLRDAKIQGTKDSLPPIYRELASSIKQQGWLAFLAGGVDGACRIGSAMPISPALQGVLRGLGEGNVIRGIERLFDATAQSEQTILQGRKSEKESQREAMIQGGNSADQAFQTVMQKAGEVAEIDRSKARM